MVVLLLLSYVGTVSAFVLLTMAIASGLYYLSELVEENTKVTKVYLERIIQVIILVHVLLILFDGFPWLLTLFSIAAQLLYFKNLSKFPFIQLTSSTFLASCVAAILNHYFWFRHFSDPAIPPHAYRKTVPTYSGPVHPPFSQIASFLGICVWLVPFALFVSLAAGDDVLPYSNEVSDETQKRKTKSRTLAKVVVEKFWSFINVVAEKLGYDLDLDRGRIV